MTDTTSSLRLGDSIGGKYRFERTLGAGNAATVVEVSDEVTGSHFAVKLLRLELVRTDGAIERFMRDALLAGRFKHPNVVELYDVGQDADSLYIVMELLQGESLSRRLERRARLSARAVGDLMMPCMQAVAAAHAAGIVHGGLKPASIFLCRDQPRAPEIPKVLDFGIAELLSDGAVPGALLRTPSYLAPEQMRGESIDPRTDVYALGVMLYELLAGRLPFEADSFPDLLLKVLSETPTPLDELAGDLPHGLGDVVMQAMSRDREARYDSLHGLKHAFQHMLHGGRIRQRQDVVQFRSVSPDALPQAVSPAGPGATPADVVPTVIDESLPAIALVAVERRYPSWPLLAVLGGALAVALITAVWLRPQATASPVSTVPKSHTAAAAPVTSQAGKRATRSEVRAASDTRSNNSPPPDAGTNTAR